MEKVAGRIEREDLAEIFARAERLRSETGGGGGRLGKAMLLELLARAKEVAKGPQTGKLRRLDQTAIVDPDELAREADEIVEGFSASGIVEGFSESAPPKADPPAPAIRLDLAASGDELGVLPFASVTRDDPRAQPRPAPSLRQLSTLLQERSSGTEDAGGLDSILAQATELTFEGYEDELASLLEETYEQYHRGSFELFPAGKTPAAQSKKKSLPNKKPLAKKPLPKEKPRKSTGRTPKPNPEPKRPTTRPSSRPGATKSDRPTGPARRNTPLADWRPPSSSGPTPSPSDSGFIRPPATPLSLPPLPSTPPLPRPVEPQPRAGTTRLTPAELVPGRAASPPPSESLRRQPPSESLRRQPHPSDSQRQRRPSDRLVQQHPADSQSPSQTYPAQHHTSGTFGMPHYPVAPLVHRGPLPPASAPAVHDPFDGDPFELVGAPTNPAQETQQAFAQQLERFGAAGMLERKNPPRGQPPSLPIRIVFDPARGLFGALLEPRLEPGDRFQLRDGQVFGVVASEYVFVADTPCYQEIRAEPLGSLRAPLHTSWE